VRDFAIPLNTLSINFQPSISPIFLLVHCWSYIARRLLQHQYVSNEANELQIFRWDRGVHWIETTTPARENAWRG
jgi:hypothetical protein